VGPVRDEREDVLGGASDPHTGFDADAQGLSRHAVAAPIEATIPQSPEIQLRATHAVDRAIEALARSAPSYVEVGDGCHDVLERALPYDQAMWMSLDPTTLMPTRFVPRFPNPIMRTLDEGLAKAFGRGSRAFTLKMMERIMAFELTQDDGLTPGTLAQTTRAVATLHGVTGGRPDRSPRYTAYPMPGLVTDELRVMLKDAGESWGMVFLTRTEGVFSRAEQDLLASIGPRLGAIVRMSLLRAAVTVGDGVADPPGLVLMADDVTVGSASPEAQALLGPWTAKTRWDWVPVLRAMRARHLRASMVVEGVSGPVTVHATTFGTQEAIIVERVRPYRLADRLVRTYGLTPREREVVSGLTRGWSTRRIAFELDLADYTVQDHLRSIFDKVGVRSRKEVVARLFFDRYMPEHRADRAPSPYGGFLGQPEG
jgi:DNA-binding CsgD family transcriptional regulator